MLEPFARQLSGVDFARKLVWATMTTAYDQSAAHRNDSEQVILATFAYLGIPQTMLDLGCGPGYMCYIASMLEVDTRGYDTGLPASQWERNLYLCKDDFLGVQLQPHELVLCLEVAEHIEESKADLLVSKLVQATGRYLLFSAATPGQGGCGHINEQPHEYWKEKLLHAGLGYSESGTSWLRQMFDIVAPSAWWYGRNVMLFEVCK